MMETAIDEHITQLKKLKSFHNGSYGESINYALDIMNKYQKIAKIIRNYDVAWEFHHMKPTIDEIRKVVEDE